MTDDEAVGVVKVKVMQVLIEGTIGGMIGARAHCGCGLTIGPEASLS